jgi:hypothetical protein
MREQHEVVGSGRMASGDSVKVMDSPLDFVAIVSSSE